MQPSLSHRSVLRQIAALTFLTFAARGLIVPFVNLYLDSVGFTGTEIGLLISISALVQLLVTPLLHTLVDRSGRHRRLYYGLVTGHIAAALGLVASASKPWLVAMIVLRDSSDSPGASLLSQLTITRLNEFERPIYGRLRAWGSLGWAVTTLISGRIFAAGGYPLLFILSSVCNLLVIPLAKVLPQHTSEQIEHTKPAPRQPAFYLLMVSNFLFCVGMSAVVAFSFIYFRQALGANNELIGIVSSVAALSEIPAMVLIDALLRRTNIRTTLVIGILGQALLWLSYTLLTGATVLVPLMIVRGTFYTFQSVSLTLLVARISHPTNAATNQAIAQVTIPGLAVLLTGGMSGWIFEHLGGQVLFQWAALVATVGAVVLIAAKRAVMSNEQKTGLSLQD
jgi:PPP family 3-phenylpropionic acid transporter